MEVGNTTTRACWRCGTEAAGLLVCARCAAVQPLAPEGDLFAVLGLPRRLEVDASELEDRYHAASRAVHPDRFQTAGPEERDLSLRASAMVNRAYRTLRDPIARGRYWLELHGRRLGEGGPQVPAAIAAEVFETQEKLEELRSAGSNAGAETLRTEVKGLRDGLEARIAGLRAEIEERYRTPGGDGSSGLDELARRLEEVAYLRTLLGDVEETIGEGLRGTNHRH
jgi:molecular chaperone HscB